MVFSAYGPFVVEETSFGEKLIPPFGLLCSNGRIGRGRFAKRSLRPAQCWGAVRPFLGLFCELPDRLTDGVRNAGWVSVGKPCYDFAGGFDVRWKRQLDISVPDGVG